MSQILLNDPQRIGGSSALALNDDLGIVGPANAVKLALWAADLNTMLGEIYSRLGYQIGTQIPFSTVVPFQSIAYMPAQSVTSQLTFAPGPSPLSGACCSVRLTADGNAAHVPVFTGFSTVSNGWNNTAGVVNLLSFLNSPNTTAYATQDGTAVGGPFIFRPSVASISLTHGVNPALTIATGGAALNPNDIPALSAFTITSPGNVTINSVSVSSSAVSLALTGTVNSGDTVTLSYTPPSLNATQSIRGGNRIQDNAGNYMAAITAAAVTVN